MKTGEKKICDEVLRYGEILNMQDYEIKEGFLRIYCIKYEGHDYEMTKLNGQWTNFIRLN